MGRIARIGNDSSANYTFLATSMYDAANPAGTTGAWPDDAAMDQAFNQASPTEVTEEGVLITFVRFPDAFQGAQVKIHPTYDVTTDDPFLEMWTHDSVTGDWTKRRRVELSNPFVGVATGTFKVFDFTLFPFLEHVDKVWLTMDPGTSGTPTMKFVGIRLFGQCAATLFRGGNTSGGDPCADPTDPFYTGFDDNGDPCPGTTFGPPPGPALPNVDLCNPASVEQYRDVLATIPGALEAFNAWFDLNSTGIASYCAGSTPTPPGGMPLPPLPPLPSLNLCDQVSIDAFRAAIGGDPDQVAAFDAFLDSLEEAGFFDLTCPAADPPETPVSPHTLQPEDDPPKTGPFGDGPGGSPPPGGNPPNGSLPPRRIVTGSGEPTEFVAFFFSGGAPTGAATVSTPGTSRQWFVDRFINTSNFKEELLTAYAHAVDPRNHQGQIIIEPNSSNQSGIKFVFTGATDGTVVQVRAIIMGISGAIVGLNQSISTALAMSGNGLPFTGAPGPGQFGPIDTGLGVFGTSNPISGATYYRINRDFSVGTLVDTLRIQAFNANRTGTGTGLNWGNALMVRIIAVAPGAHSAVTVVGSYYN